MAFKFQVNRMKIEVFGNLAYIDLLVYIDLKINSKLSSATSFANGFQISSQSEENWGFCKIWPNLAKIGFLAEVDLNTNRCLNSTSWYTNGLQISSQLDENWQF